MNFAIFTSSHSRPHQHRTNFAVAPQWWAVTPKLKLAIIIPACDEEASIGYVLRNIPRGLAAQIILVDNGSTDDTAAHAREVAAEAGHVGFEVVSEPRRGYGRACLTGLTRLRDEIQAVAMLDGDGSDDPNMLVAMMTLMERERADLVLGVRTLGDAQKVLTRPQRTGTRLACSLIQMIWAYRYADVAQLRVIRREPLDRLQMSDTTWGWSIEMQIKAVHYGLRIRELPVRYRPRYAGHSKISGTLGGVFSTRFAILTTVAQHWWQAPRLPRG